MSAIRLRTRYGSQRDWRETGETPNRFPRRRVPGEWDTEQTGIVHPGTWHREAACRAADVDPDSPRLIEWCSRCPVAEECLAEALEAEDGTPVTWRSGIRGGLSPHERRSYERKGVVPAPRMLAPTKRERRPALVRQIAQGLRCGSHPDILLYGYECWKCRNEVAEAAGSPLVTMPLSALPSRVDFGGLAYRVSEDGETWTPVSEYAIRLTATQKESS